MLEYIQKYIPEKFVGVLAGSSVHCDRMFLVEYMPKLVEHLHYRYVSVTLGHTSFSGFIIVVQDRWYEILPRLMEELNCDHDCPPDVSSIKVSSIFMFAPLARTLYNPT